MLARAHQAAAGTEPQTFVATAYLDCRVYALFGKVPALCYGVEAVSPLPRPVSIAPHRGWVAGRQLHMPPERHGQT